jgi:hypothetical protein
MAYPVLSTITKEIFITGASPATFQLPAGLVEGDEVYIYAGGLISGTVTVTGDAGWVNLSPSTNHLDQGNGGYLYGFHQRVPFGGLTNPTITWSNSASRQLGVMSIVVKGALTTGASSSEGDIKTAAASTTATTAALTLTENPQLVLIPFTYERSTEKAMLEATNAVEIAFADPDGSDNGHVGLAYTYVSTSDSATFSVQTEELTTNGGVAIAAHAIIDNGNGDIIGYTKHRTSSVLLYNPGGHNGLTKTEVDPTNVAHTPQLPATVTHPISGSVETTQTDGFINGKGAHKLSTSAHMVALQPNAGEGDKFLVRGLTFAAQNLTGKLINFLGELQKASTKSLGRFGRCIGFGDGTNIAFFLFGGGDSGQDDGWNTFAIDTNSTLGTNYDSGTTNATTGYEILLVGAGTLNWGAITEVLFEINTSASGLYYFAGCVHLENEPLTILGGRTADPITFDMFYRGAITGSLNTVQKQGSSQYFTQQNIQVGDGSRTTIFGGGVQTLEYPLAYSYADGAINTMADEGALSFTVKASATCNMDFSKKSINSGNFGKFIIDSGSSASATYNFNGFPVYSSLVELYGLALATYEGIILDGTKSLTHANFNKTAGRTFGAIVVRNCVSAFFIEVASQDEFEALQGTVFSNCIALAIKINGNHGGQTWIASGMSTSGGAGSFDIEYTGTGTLTISVDAGSGWEQSRVTATGGGVLTIAAPLPAVTITVKDASTLLPIQGARLYLQADAGGPLAEGAEIFNELTDVNGQVSNPSYFYTADQPISGRVRKGSGVPFYKTGQISGSILSSGFSTTVFLVRD